MYFVIQQKYTYYCMGAQVLELFISLYQYGVEDLHQELDSSEALDVGPFPCLYFIHRLTRSLGLQCFRKKIYYLFNG